MENLGDPLGDRVMKNVPMIASEPLSKDELYITKNGKRIPDIDRLRKHLLREGRLAKPELLEILGEVTKILKKEPNVMRIKEPVIIVGDIHGQYYDMIHMFEKVVDQRNLGVTNMLFLGDYVDRGNYSNEVLIFLYALKICYPSNIIMLRGNHESRAMTEHFTFREEILSKYDGDESVYEAYIESFEALPLAADVNGDYLCMHGGISPELKTVDDINKIDRFIEPPLSGFLCDLLWSDPCADKEARHLKYSKNVERECSYKFGLDPVKQLLKKNNFLSIIRAHQVQIDGYKMHRWGGSQAFPSVITVFSAPNYCGSYKNKGAVILIENDKMNIKQYKDVEQPFHLPGGLDLFSWSLPFLADKISEMLDYLVKKNTIIDKKDIQMARRSSNIDFNHIIATLNEDKKTEDVQKFNKIKAKVLTMGRISKMLKNAHDNTDAITKMKEMSADGMLPKGVLDQSLKECKTEVDQFVALHKIDKNNEKFPVVEFKRRESMKQGIDPDMIAKLQKEHGS